MAGSVIPLASRAYVNRSATNIPIYSSADHSTQVGTIYPNEMYSVSPIPNHTAHMMATFRNSNNVKATGYIQREAWEASDPPAWIAQQADFHLWNSNGSSLVASESVTMEGKTYKIFTIKHTLHFYIGGTWTGDLAAGTRIAMDSSTVGQAHPDRINVDYVEDKSGATPKWAAKSDFWVDLGFNIGSTPKTRPIW